MALKHVKRCSISLIIRVITFSPTRLGEIKKYDSTFTGKAVGKQAFSYSAVCICLDCKQIHFLLEENLVILNNKTYTLTFQPRNPTLVILP